MLGFGNFLIGRLQWQQKWVAANEAQIAGLQGEIDNLTQQFSDAGFDNHRFGIRAGDDWYFYGGKGLEGAVDVARNANRMDGIRSVFVEDYMLVTGAGALAKMAGTAAVNRLATREAGAIASESPTVLARRLGAEGEAAVGLSGPKTGIRIPGTNRLRVPDSMTSTTLTEVKNRAYVSFTSQLRDYAAYAQQNNLIFELFVRPSATVSKTLLEAERIGQVIIKTIGGA